MCGAIGDARTMDFLQCQRNAQAIWCPELHRVDLLQEGQHNHLLTNTSEQLAAYPVMRAHISEQLHASKRSRGGRKSSNHQSVRQKQAWSAERTHGCPQPVPPAKQQQRRCGAPGTHSFRPTGWGTAGTPPPHCAAAAHARASAADRQPQTLRSRQSHIRRICGRHTEQSQPRFRFWWHPALHHITHKTYNAQLCRCQKSRTRNAWST